MSAPGSNGESAKPKKSKTKPTVGKISNAVYDAEIFRLQTEFVKLQEWVRATGARVVVIFEGRDAADPWGDSRDGHWSVAPGETLDGLLAALDAQAERSGQVIAAHDLSDVGVPGERWDGAPPATLERILFHLLQEYARHLGQLDIVCELADAGTGE